MILKQRIEKQRDSRMRTHKGRKLFVKSHFLWHTHKVVSETFPWSAAYPILVRIRIRYFTWPWSEGTNIPARLYNLNSLNGYHYVIWSTRVRSLLLPYALRSCDNVRISWGEGGFSGLISLVAYSWNRTLRPSPGIGLPFVGWRRA